MLKVRFGGNLLQRTSQILTYRHVDRIFTFSTDPFKRNDKQIEEYRGANLFILSNLFSWFQFEKGKEDIQAYKQM